MFVAGVCRQRTRLLRLAAVDLYPVQFQQAVQRRPADTQQPRGHRQRMIAARPRETREEWLEPQPHVWRIIDGTEQPFTMAIGVWIDGEPTMAGLPIRARMGWNSVTGGRHAPIVVSVTQVADWSHVTPARRQALAAGLKSFLRDHADWDSQIRTMSAHP
jgi:hypothetical protein